VDGKPGIRSSYAVGDKNVMFFSIRVSLTIFIGLLSIPLEIRTLLKI